MKRTSSKISRMITKGLSDLVKTRQFINWFSKQNAKDKDIIVINNSFIYRKPLIKTTKNKKYLCLQVKKSKPDTREIFVVEPGNFDSDFKLFSAKSKNLPKLKPLSREIQTEISHLGRLVFVLIGRLEDVPASVSLNHKAVKELRFDPAGQARVQVLDDGKTLVVNQLVNSGIAWESIQSELFDSLGNDVESLRTEFAAAFEKLQQEARVRLVLPEAGRSRSDGTLIEKIRLSVSEQLRLYKDALQRYQKGSEDAAVHLREIMRIAYNFADDAIKVLKLLVSVADIKGIILWSTIKEHFDVAEAFRNLPRTEQHDRWLGFKRQDIELWLVDAGLKEVLVDCVGEDCCAQSSCGCESASISIFIATGVK